MTTLLKSYPKKLSTLIDEILAQIWNCLVQNSEIYSIQVVNSDSYNLKNSVDEGKLFFTNYMLFFFLIFCFYKIIFFINVIILTNITIIKF